MSEMPTIDDLLAKPATIEDVIAALHGLVADLKANPDDWENPSLDRYLSAMAAWLESFRGRLDDEPNWRFVVTALEAAKMYE
jgi:hypothetical protein